jgi:hypothetical protein
LDMTTERHRETTSLRWNTKIRMLRGLKSHMLSITMRALFLFICLGNKSRNQRNSAHRNHPPTRFTNPPLNRWSLLDISHPASRQTKSCRVFLFSPRLFCLPYTLKCLVGRSNKPPAPSTVPKSPRSAWLNSYASHRHAEAPRITRALSSREYTITYFGSDRFEYMLL